MNTSQASLVIVGANTPDCKVFWKGIPVPGVVGVLADNDHDTQRVVLRVQEDPMLAEMQAAGIIVRRAA
jgi:hypothetical protein